MLSLDFQGRRDVVPTSLLGHYHGETRGSRIIGPEVCQLDSRSEESNGIGCAGVTDRRSVFRRKLERYGAIVIMGEVEGEAGA
jgi:hypothetical protein